MSIDIKDINNKVAEEELLAKTIKQKENAAEVEPTENPFSIKDIAKEKVTEMEGKCGGSHSSEDEEISTDITPSQAMDLARQVKDELSPNGDEQDMPSVTEKAFELAENIPGLEDEAAAKKAVKKIVAAYKTL